MPEKKIQEIYVETLSTINFSHGLVRLFFVGHDLENMTKDAEPKGLPTELRQCVTMPLPGFLYAASVISNFMGEEKFKELLERYKSVGFLPQSEPKESSV